ncbi:MAG: hypothetical protein RL660_1825 [Bacteroidota bacterium]|jgi:hypothetical protein
MAITFQWLYAASPSAEGILCQMKWALQDKQDLQTVVADNAGDIFIINSAELVYAGTMYDYISLQHKGATVVFTGKADKQHQTALDVEQRRAHESNKASLIASQLEKIFTSWGDYIAFVVQSNIQNQVQHSNWFKCILLSSCLSFLKPPRL